MIKKILAEIRDAFKNHPHVFRQADSMYISGLPKQTQEYFLHRMRCFVFTHLSGSPVTIFPYVKLMLN